MDQQQRNFLNLTALYVYGSNNKAYELNIENPDWNEIYKLSCIHNLSGMLYTVVHGRNLCGDETIMNNMSKAFILTVGNSVNQEMVLSGLIDLFNSNGVRHIIFKGTVLREYYPDKELRTMGDIDLVIDEAERKRVHRILMDNGASYDEVGSHADVFNYSLNGVLFEIHTSVMDENLFDDIDCVDYFRNLFSHTELCKMCTYELRKEFHFIYLLVHMAKHFKFGGCGLRMYIDIVMFIRHFDGKMDWNYIRAELKKLRLIEFADSVFQFCNKWFGTDISLFENEMSEAEIDMITEYVLAGGIFGYYDKNIDAIRAGNKNSSLFSKIKTVICFLFPSYAHLKRRYEWMNDIPGLLLPVAWIKYWHYRIFVVKQDNIKRIKQAAESSEDAKKHYRLMEKIGLV